jgi:hypothetical protein
VTAFVRVALSTADLLVLAQLASEQVDGTCELAIVGNAEGSEHITVHGTNPRRVVATFARRDVPEGSRWERRS